MELSHHLKKYYILISTHILLNISEELVVIYSEQTLFIFLYNDHSNTYYHFLSYIDMIDKLIRSFFFLHKTK
uniref:Uncharacterized protein n=1 Tax=Lepeophtheirus salmonis TaxID=72036 RepID=A0A0K2TBV4_LEPSM